MLWFNVNRLRKRMAPQISRLVNCHLSGLQLMVSCPRKMIITVLIIRRPCRQHMVGLPVIMPLWMWTGCLNPISDQSTNLLFNSTFEIHCLCVFLYFVFGFSSSLSLSVTLSPTLPLSLCRFHCGAAFWSLIIGTGDLQSENLFQCRLNMEMKWQYLCEN